MREQNQQQQTRVLHEMCSMILQILRSPPFPNPFDSSSSSSLSSLYRTTSPVSSPSAFASLFLAISLALMMLGSVTFTIGFVLMPWVVGLVLLFCFVAVVSDLLELGRSILCPTASSKDVTELDELYVVNVSDHLTDAGKASPEAAQHAVQHEAAQHAP